MPASFISLSSKKGGRHQGFQFFIKLNNEYIPGAVVITLIKRARSCREILRTGKARHENIAIIVNPDTIGSLIFTAPD